jgi:hypothetical protein
MLVELFTIIDELLFYWIISVHVMTGYLLIVWGELQSGHRMLRDVV